MGTRRLVAEFFLDTSFAIALSSPPDQYYKGALALAEQIERDETKLVTTRAVLLEIGNALSKQRHRGAGVALLEAIESDPRIEIVPLSEDLYDRAVRMYRDRPDKEWGLTDCAG